MLKQKTIGASHNRSSDYTLHSHCCNLTSMIGAASNATVAVASHRDSDTTAHLTRRTVKAESYYWSHCNLYLRFADFFSDDKLRSSSFIYIIVINGIIGGKEAACQKCTCQPVWRRIILHIEREDGDQPNGEYHIWQVNKD